MATRKQHKPNAKPNVTPERAIELLKEDELSIARKVETCKPLTGPERKLLREIAARSLADKAPEGWALKKTQLATALCIHLNTVTNHLTDPDHPKRVAGLGWPISECRTYYAAKGVIKSGSISGNGALEKKLEAEARTQAAKAIIFESKAKVVEKKLLPADEVGDRWIEAVSEMTSRLRSVAATMAPRIAGKLPDEVEKLIRDEIDDCLSGLAIFPFCSDEFKKKLRGLRLGEKFTTEIPAHFDHLHAKAQSHGFSETSDLEPESLAPDLLG